MEIDSEKIRAKLTELNSGRSSNDLLWIEAGGFHSLIKTEIKNTGILFFGDSGFIVKAFINRETGEIKLFPAKMFELMHD